MPNQSTPRKVASSRANGAKSKGPVTPEGKAHSSGNAIKHGLAGGRVILDIEDCAPYDELYGAYARRFQPCDPLEVDLVEDMVNCRWRIRPTILMESETINQQIWNQDADIRERFKNPRPVTHLMCAVDTLLEQYTCLETLQRYETRLTGQYARAYKSLLDLRKNIPIPDENIPIPDEIPMAATLVTPKNENAIESAVRF